MYVKRLLCEHEKYIVYRQHYMIYLSTEKNKYKNNKIKG